MTLMRGAAGGLLLALVLSACGGGAASPSASASAAATVKVATNAKLGKILVAADNGKTLYFFDKDSPNKSTCTGSCADRWPAFTISSGTPVAPAGLSGKLGVIAATSGGQQVTWDSKPLYFFGGDKAAGDTNGDGVAGVWHAVKNP